MIEGKIKFCALECSIFIVAVLIVAFSTSISQNIAEEYNFSSLYSNWRKGPISEIISPNSTSCPNGYFPLIDDAWPGLVPSCICNDYEMNNFVYGKVRRGICRSKRDSFLFCKTVRRVNPRYFTSYRGKTLCAKRMTENYWEFSISSKASFCKVGSRSCGKADSLGNYLCVPTNINCPINTIKIIGKNDQLYPNNINYTKIELSGNKILAFTNQNPEGRIITEFKVSESQPCINPYFMNKTIPAYKLDPYFQRENCVTGLAGEKVDDRYIRLDDYNNYDLVNENNFTKIYQFYPDYDNRTLKYPINIYYRSFIGVNEQCYSYFQNKNPFKARIGNTTSNNGLLSDLLSIRKNSIEARNFSLISTSYSYISIGIVAIGTIIFLIILGFEEDKYLHGKVCQIFFKCFTIFLAFIMFVLVWISIGKFSKVPDLYSEIKNNGYSGCSDIYTNDLFLKFSSVLSFCKNLSVVTTLISLGLVALISVLVVYLFYTPFRDEVEQPQQPDNVFNYY